MTSRSEVTKLPSNVLAGASPIPEHNSKYNIDQIKAGCVEGGLGVRRVNHICLELLSGTNTLKNAHRSAIGVLFLAGLFFDFLYIFIYQESFSGKIVFLMVFIPMLSSFVGLLLYLSTRNIRGGHVRVNRNSRKIYYVIPGEKRLVTMRWDEIKPMVGYFPISGGMSGGTVLYPLLLVGVDWTKSPPQEASVSCGNLGWRDNGESACELFCYIQHFMKYGPQGLPMPGPLPSKMSRKDTFLYGYQQWAKKFREDLSTPKGKRWAVLWAPAKVLWLITMVFPDSIGTYLDYTVPEVRFPEEIDLLCGFESDNDDLSNC